MLTGPFPEEKGTFISGATKASGRPNRNVPGTSQAKAKQHLSFPPLASSSFILQHLRFPISLSGRHISSLNEMERRIDSYGTGVYTMLADIINWERALPSMWWISARAQNCQPQWMSCQPRGRAGWRNKPLSPAVCLVFTTLLVFTAKITQSVGCSQRLIYISCTLYIHT